jgi:glycine betaine/proline transport system permease protein
MFGIEIGTWIADQVNAFVKLIVSYLGQFFRSISAAVETAYEAITDVLQIVPDPFTEITLIVLAALLLWRIANWKIAVGSAAGLVLVALLGLWESAIDTFVLVILATFMSLVVSIPIGIIMGLSNKFERFMSPVLDLMQTMPAFVYLIPVVMFFGVGVVPAVFATMIFAMPPPIRLTSLALRGVSHDVKETAISFGATEFQMLRKVQIPLAIPTIMAGVNQCIMLSLSMAVISSMIGAAGLGGEVLRGITRLDVGHGFIAGVSIVCMAIILDRTAIAVHKKTMQRTNISTPGS